MFKQQIRSPNHNSKVKKIEQKLLDDTLTSKAQINTMIQPKNRQIPLMY